MTRQEKQQRVQNPDGKVFENLNVDIRETHRSQQYTCSKQVANVMTSTGHLKIFELVPLSQGLPSFVARWDEKAESLDIDIEGVAEAETIRFKEGKGGYSGHWSKRIPNTSTIYTYEVCIHAPEGQVFAGTVGFTVVRRQGITAGDYSLRGFQR